MDSGESVGAGSNLPGSGFIERACQLLKPVTHQKHQSEGAGGKGEVPTPYHPGEC